MPMPENPFTYELEDHAWAYYIRQEDPNLPPPPWYTFDILHHDGEGSCVLIRGKTDHNYSEAPNPADANAGLYHNIQIIRALAAVPGMLAIVRALAEQETPNLDKLRGSSKETVQFILTGAAWGKENSRTAPERIYEEE